MKRCVQCGGRDILPTRVRRTVTVAGETYRRMVPAERCAACRETYVRDADLETFELGVASDLAGARPASGDAFRFMRKSLGLTAAEMARLLDVTLETVSRWENGHRPIPRAAFALVGTLVAERLAGRSDAMARLRALAGPRAA